MRFTLIYARTAQRQQERKRDRTHRVCRLLRFPRLAGMVPVSLLLERSLQQWEHEDKIMQRERERKTE